MAPRTRFTVARRMLCLAVLLNVGASCIALDGVLFSSDNLCGDGIVQGDEECDDANLEDNDGCIECRAAFCGDGFLFDEVEQCDPGIDPSCHSSCVLCGNGVVEESEDCDDANVADDDDCVAGCVSARCGDGHVRAGVETCDDENDDDTDACAACLVARCGDGFVQAGVELCDDGNDLSTDACVECAPASCHDGYLWIGVEVCDDGNTSNSDACVGECVAAFCGDGFPWTEQGGTEQCDDANDDNTDDCTELCLGAGCGDGFLQGAEQCDDDNEAPGDGCDGACQCECAAVPLAGCEAFCS